MQVIFYIVVIIVSLTTALRDEEIQQKWLNFKEKYNKKYNKSLVEQIRYKIFKQNLEMIQKHNEKYQNGEVSYEMGINLYTDMEAKEIERNLMSADILERDQNLCVNSTTFASLPISKAIIPKSLDWRKKGAITPVKDQKSCGSCWAFSSTGALEAHYFLKSKKPPVILSEQHLIDCVMENRGCGGGWMNKAFMYVQANDGINTEISYPYEVKQGQCRFRPQHIGATCSGYVSLRSGDEKQLLEAVATHGPISVAFYTLPSVFHYKTGIYDEHNCKSHSLHAVLIVGYGTENGRDYWLVKNSWGSDWGDKGYIKMTRNKKNQCGIASWASYPIILI